MPRGSSGPFPLLGITFYCFVLAVIATLVDYGFGVGNQVELLPGILRAMDPTYLANDFFVNTTDDFGPRIAYFKIVGFVGSLVGIEPASFLLLLLSNLGAIYVTYRVAEKLFPTVRFAPAVAALFACTSALRHGMLGGVAKLSNSTLVPEDLARPLCFLAVLLCLNRRYGLASLALLGASLFHPLAAALFGLVAFVASAFADRRSGERRPWLPLVWLGAVAAVIYGVWIRPLERSLSDQQFFEIVANFRLPHHHLPSTFEWIDVVLFGLTLSTGFIAFKSWARRQGSLQHASWVGSAALMILILFVACFVFVEIWPSRLVLSAQLFRLSLMLHWLIVLCVAYPVGRLLWIAVRRFIPLPLPFFAVAGPVAPALYLAAMAMGNPRRKVTLVGAFTIAVLAVVASRVQDLPQAIRLTLGFATLVPMFFSFRRMATSWLAAGVALVLASLLVHSMTPTNWLPARISSLAPTTTLAQARRGDPLSDVAGYARTGTLREAVFIVPPDAGSFRFLAERAIVVDYKAFPFQDDAMAEWYQRMKDVFGPELILRDYDASMKDMKERYKRISDTRLKELAVKCGATHAVLNAETNTNLPILFEGKTHKIVLCNPLVRDLR